MPSPVPNPVPNPVIGAPEAPAAWTKPLVRIDAVWTRIETYMVLAVLIMAILYMSGWVTLNAFHTKGGKLARVPGLIALFAGLASALTWTRRADRKNRELFVPALLTLLGLVLLLVAGKQEYFSNVARWLSDASIIKQIGTPAIVSARMFTIWVALLGGSLATGSGRQINIDVVMRFIGPRPRLAVALLGYAVAAFACFVVSWGFCDYLAITRFSATKEMAPSAKMGVIADGVSRHMFIARKQLAMDVRSFGHVVLKGEDFDKWYKGADWNADLNEGGWASVYPPPAPATAPAAGAPAMPTKPCLTGKEIEDLVAKGGTTNGEWRLPAACDTSEGGTRPPLANAPEPDDRTPLEADLSLLFPWGFFVIGCRFLMRGILAAGGAVSTDPNAAHGAGGDGHEGAVGTTPLGDVAVHPPIVERNVDAEARAHEGELALPRDDASVLDALQAASA